VQNFTIHRGSLTYQDWESFLLEFRNRGILVAVYSELGAPGESSNCPSKASTYAGDTRNVSIRWGTPKDCDLRIPLSDVSRKHCRLVRDGETLRLEDLGSSNGTYRNGERVQEAILSPGDTLQVGPVQFVLQIDGEPADDQLAPGYAEQPMPGAEEEYGEAEVSADVSDAATDDAETVDDSEGVTAAHELSENATIDEPAEPVVAKAPPPIPTPPPIPAAIAAPAKKTNGVHAAPPIPVPVAPAAESDEAPPFQGLDEVEAGGEEQDFFIVDEPSSSSQSGEIQIDMDSPPA
jgi:pSer/pThr/pTyr-binding forkhead associated (FHA) protein